MNEGRLIAFIDIGGSSMKVYVCRKGKCKLVKIYTWGDEDDIQYTIITTSEWIKETYKCPDLIIGLPGPVDKSQEHVFCPPLNVVVSLMRLNEIATLVVNDVICQAGILLCSMNSEVQMGKNALITVGTSLGICVFDGNLSIYQSLAQAKSYEIAHEFLNDWNTEIDSDKIKLLIKNKESRLCTLFSAGGLCAYMDGVVEVRHEYMLIAEKSDIANILTYNITENAKVKIKMWFKDLVNTCENYLSKEGEEINKMNFIISGGIVNAIRASGIDYGLENYTLDSRIG